MSTGANVSRREMAKNLTFMNLPTEVRQKIYDYTIPVVIRVKKVKIVKKGKPARPQQIRIVHSLTRTSRSVRYDVFCFIWKFQRTYSVECSFVPEFLDIVGPEGRSSITSLKLQAFKWDPRMLGDGRLTEGALKALNHYDMVSTGLRHLIIRSRAIDTSNWRGPPEPEFLVRQRHVRPLEELTGLESFTVEWNQHEGWLIAIMEKMQRFTERYYEKRLIKKTTEDKGGEAK